MLALSWQSIRVILALFFAVVTGATTNFEELYAGIAAVAPDIRITGEQYIDAPNGKGFAYYGIKYAAAERFEPSVANTDYAYLSDPSWPKQGYICPQLEEQPFNRIQSEDCLYLDVYVPPVTRDHNSLFPVMMYIHGGGFINGNKDLYNSTVLAVAINAIVVTVNYRLAVLGFLSTGDQAAVGNWALYDLNLALNWIEENVAAFGGDIEKINIFGESAGAALTSALMLNDNVRGTVRSALAMSGSVFDDWTIVKDPKSHAVDLAKQLECPTETSVKLIACLKSVPLDRIMNSSNAPLSPDLAIPFAMVVDGHHISPLKSYFQDNSLPKSGKSANFITWYMTEESAYFVFAGASKPDEVLGPNSILDYPQIKARIPGQLIGYVDSPRQLHAAAAKVMAFYNIAESDDKPTLIRKYLHSFTGSQFAYGTLKESQAYSNRPSPLQFSNQFCLISYDSGLVGLGAFHSMDIAYIFSGSEVCNGWVRLGLVIHDHVMNAFHDILRDIAYNGSTNGLSFGNGQVQNYLHLNEAGQWVNEQADFRLITNLYDSLRELPFSSSALSHVMQNTSVSLLVVVYFFYLAMPAY